MINDDLKYIYELLAKQLRIEIGFDLNSCPSKDEEMEEDMLIKKYKRNFIFLKKGKAFTEHYNLIAFCVLGGNFEFGIHTVYFYDCIYGDASWNEDLKRWVLKKMALPKHLNGYNLYSGLFLTNTVKLKIKRP